MYFVGSYIDICMRTENQTANKSIVMSISMLRVSSDGVSATHHPVVFILLTLWLCCPCGSLTDEFRGHSLLQAAREADLLRVKKHLSLETITFKHPHTQETALVRVFIYTYCRTKKQLNICLVFFLNWSFSGPSRTVCSTGVCNVLKADKLVSTSVLDINT